MIFSVLKFTHFEFTLESVRDLTNYKLLYNTDVQDVKRYGELMIKVPHGIELKKIQSHDAETLDSVFVPVVVRIEYSLIDPSDGISFVHPRAARDRNKNFSFAKLNKKQHFMTVRKALAELSIFQQWVSNRV